MFDHIYTNEPQRISKTKIVENVESDHSAICLIRPMRIRGENPYYLTKRDFSDTDYSKMAAIINNHKDFMNIFETQDVNTIKETILRIIN